jgi:hypothetical protein
MADFPLHLMADCPLTYPGSGLLRPLTVLLTLHLALLMLTRTPPQAVLMRLPVVLSCLCV